MLARRYGRSSLAVCPASTEGDHLRFIPCDASNLNCVADEYIFKIMQSTIVKYILSFLQLYDSTTSIDLIVLGQRINPDTP